MWLLDQLSDWFPQADIFRVLCKIAHVRHCDLQQKKKDQQCNAHEQAAAPKYVGEALAVTSSPQPLDGVLRESTQMRAQVLRICSTLTSFYVVKIA